MSEKQEEQEKKQEKKQEEKQEEKPVQKKDKYADLKLCISALVCFLLIGLIFFPFIHNGFFCTDALSSKIVGNVLLYLTILPLSLIGLGLMFYIHPTIIAFIYLIYYGLICWSWCHSRWMFVILSVLYIPYFYLMIKAKDIYRMFMNIADELNVDDILNKVKIDKKNDNSNK